MSPYSKHLFAYFITILTIFSLTGCGGSSGGSGDSTRPKYLVVSSVSPANGAENVDARIESIEIHFPSPIDPALFVKESAALSKLLAGTAEREQIKIKNNKTNAIVSVGSLKLADLKSGAYSAIRYNPDGTEFYLVIDSYSFFQEPNGGYGLKIDLRGTENDITFSSAEITSAELVNSNLVRVQLEDGSASAVGQVVVDSKTIRFYPVNYLNWNSSYSVTVDKSVKDTDYGNNLAENYNFKFKTAPLPDAVIATSSPLGSSASPIEKIYAIPNFKVTGAVSSSNVSLYEVIRTASDDSNPTKTRIASNISYNGGTNAIEIVPTQELKHIREYEVVIKSGLSGSLGNYPVQLPNDHTWTFITAPVSVIGHSPSGASPDTANVNPNTKISINLNFRASDAHIQSGISIVNLNRNTKVPYTVESNVDGHLVLRPNSKLAYGTKYAVTIGTALISVTDSTVRLIEEYSFSFTTEQRVILSISPSHLSKDVSENSKIQVEFNFEPAAGQWNDLGKFSVQQQVDGGSWKTVQGHSEFGYVGANILEFVPDVPFLFNAKIRVTLTGQFLAADGQPLFNPQFAEFTVRNDAFVMTSSNPKNNDQYVLLNSEISAFMSEEIDLSTVKSNSIKIVAYGCGYSGSGPSGTTYAYGKELYFVPSQTLKSNCTHEVTIDSGVKGVNNREQEKTHTFKFTTDYLSVDAVYVDYAYGDFVDVYSTVEIQFNYPLGYLYSGDIKLLNVDANGSQVAGSWSTNGFSAKFSSYSPLDYGTEYKVVVTTNVVGSNGERMTAEKSSYFVTQNIPLDVYDYGPTGYVFIDDIFWVDLNFAVTKPGFPDVKGSLTEYYGSYSTYTKGARVTTDGAYTLYLTPDSLLAYDTDYDVNFTFDFYGTSTDDFTFSWPVLSEETYSSSALSANKESRQALTAANGRVPSEKAMSRNQRVVGPVKADRSCRNNKKCVGQIRTKDTLEYKKVLAAKSRENILENKERANVQNLKRKAKRAKGPSRR